VTATLLATGFPALGTTVRILVTDPAALAESRLVVEAEVDALDRACSRFRADSELAEVNRASGRPVTVGPLLFEALEAATWAARETDGLVDPTVGAALEALGYDRDFATNLDSGLVDDGSLGDQRSLDAAGPAPGWRLIRLDRERRSVTVPSGVRLDLGSTAKALGSDRAARAGAEATGSGVLVSLGGDMAVGGPPPPGGWRVRVTDDHAAGPEATGQTICLWAGGLATSSVTVRHWRRGPELVHHIVDPTTGRSASIVWRTVSVVAASCLQANAASTAAMVLGERAPTWLESRRLPARLVRSDGVVVRVAGWPKDHS
jgi:FAD:protein FMN transferase